MYSLHEVSRLNLEWLQNHLDQLGLGAIRASGLVDNLFVVDSLADSRGPLSGIYHVDQREILVNAYSDRSLEETAVHELAHAADIMAGVRMGLPRGCCASNRSGTVFNIVARMGRGRVYLPLVSTRNRQQYARERWGELPEALACSVGAWVKQRMAERGMAQLTTNEQRIFGRSDVRNLLTYVEQRLYPLLVVMSRGQSCVQPVARLPQQRRLTRPVLSLGQRAFDPRTLKVGRVRGRYLRKKGGR
ncbi:MAG TPA: hypothetical protein VKA46_21525 [Gemmataceae bacterium]|nr:hypothetical protein [Gemmataceae bacterium]HYW81917.1 hypothetical protein [Spirochaetia bacterium]